MHDQDLFGVAKGLQSALTMRWSQDTKGEGQELSITVEWENRKPTMWFLQIPDEDQLPAYMALFMPVIMNGSWMHSQRFIASLKSALLKAQGMGAELRSAGSRL